MPLNDAQSDALLAAIREVAAQEIRPHFRDLAQDAIDAKSTFDDLVTVADRAAETALTQRVADLLPGASVVGEEAVSANGRVLDRVADGRCVVIDPIDGTWNFAHGLANYGVIVAVIEDGVTVWGCLYDPNFDDWVLGVKDGGCHFHSGDRRHPLKVSQDDIPFERLRGNIGEYLYPAADRPGLSALVPRFRRYTNLGASVHEYRMLCQGGTDFVLNGGLNVWDHAAGVLCFQEAGGVSRLLDGFCYEPVLTKGRLLSARTEKLWRALADAFNDALSGPLGEPVV